MPTRDRLGGGSRRPSRPGERAPAAPELAPVQVRNERGITTLTIQNPPYNVLNSNVVEALAAATEATIEDSQTRAIILTGAGNRAFSVGADIREMVDMSREEAVRYSAKGDALTNLLERSPVPVIAAVRGFCLGGGFEMALACDFIVAAEDAVFAQPEVNLGILPGWGGTRRLTRRIGVARARRWILTGERVPAERALKDGVVDRIVPAGNLMAEAEKLAGDLFSKPALALAAAKYAVNYASDAQRLLGLEYERDLWGDLFESEEPREGMRAFLERREPHFPEGDPWRKARGEYPLSEQWAVYEEAKRELGSRGKPAPVPPVLGWIELWQRSTGTFLEHLLKASLFALDQYRRWLGEAWKRSPPGSRSTGGD